MAQLVQLENAILNGDTIKLNREYGKMYLLGIEDAKIYYHYPLDFFSGFLVGSIFPFTAGYAMAIVADDACCAIPTSLIMSIFPPVFVGITSKKDPNVPIFLFPNEDYMNDEEYMRGYMKIAKKRKNTNRLMGVLVGVVAGTVGATLLAVETLGRDPWWL
ncbi:hypothetical protein JYT53_00995 [Cytophagaceae bacterium AH-315-L13]|nr:hypothetical protein [Cytophagaceae bacterium AH-315-L13]